MRGTFRGVKSLQRIASLGQRLWVFVFVFLCLGCADRKLDITFLTSKVFGVSVELSSSSGLHTNLDAIPVRVDFAEQVADLSSLRIEIEGGTLSSSTPLMGGGTTFDILIDTTLEEGELKISIPAQELLFEVEPGAPAILKSTKSAVLKRHVDRVPPTLESVMTSPSIGNKESRFIWEFKVHGAETVEVRPEHIILEGAVLGCVSEILESRSSSVKVQVSGCETDGDLNLQIEENVASDLAGNQSARTSGALTVMVDNTPPAIEVFVMGAPLGNVHTTFAWQVSFGDAQEINLSENSIRLLGPATQGCLVTVHPAGTNKRNVEVRNCSGDGNLYFEILPGAAKDLAGNLTEIYSATPTVDVDNTPPGLTLANVGATSGTQTTVFEWQANYTNASAITLAPGDVVFSGESAGCIATVTGTDVISRAIRVTGCSGVTDFKMTIKAGTARDDAGNLAGEVHSAVIDLTNPVKVSFEKAISVLDKATGDAQQSVIVNLARPVPQEVRVELNILGETTANNPVNYNLAAVPEIIFPANTTQGELRYTYYGASLGSKVIQLGLSAASPAGVTFDLSTQPHRRLVKDMSAHDASYKSVALGENHSCGIATDNSLKCWGNNTYGELGIGTTTGSRRPVAVTGLAGVKEVSLGNSHTCAVLLNEDLYCWGNGASARLGLGTIVTHQTPQLVGTGYRSVSAGGDFTCAIKTDDKLYCWGGNASGQLGLGTTTTQNTPAPLLAAHNILQVSSGDVHACAITSTNQLYCWGGGTSGQLGLGANLGNTTPQLLGSSYMKVSAGMDFTCALKTANDLYCWGKNSEGQGGYGTWNNSNSPQQVAGQYTDISAGGLHSCAVTNTDGNVKCWGSNVSGQVGDGTVIGRNVPTDVLPGFISVSAGHYHTCAVKTDGTVYCWGQNAAGQAGEGALVNIPSPLAPAVP